MLSDVRPLVAGISILVLAVGPAAAAPPTAGEVVPGASLGGLRLGATKAQVERAWGRAYGICTNCPKETWYFNYFAFEPEGVGVELRGGRAAALFTLHSPAGWRTKRGARARRRCRGGARHVRRADALRLRRLLRARHRDGPAAEPPSTSCASGSGRSGSAGRASVSVASAPRAHRREARRSSARRARPRRPRRGADRAPSP